MQIIKITKIIKKKKNLQICSVLLSTDKREGESRQERQAGGKAIFCRSWVCLSPPHPPTPPSWLRSSGSGRTGRDRRQSRPEEPEPLIAAAADPPVPPLHPRAAGAPLRPRLPVPSSMASTVSGRAARYPRFLYIHIYIDLEVFGGFFFPPGLCGFGCIVPHRPAHTPPWCEAVGALLIFIAIHP